MIDQIRHCSRHAALPKCGVTNWRRRSPGLRRGLECDTGSAARMHRKTFSESFSKWVRNCSSQQRQSTLNLFGTSRNFEPKNGHEPPDSDLRLQIVTGWCQNSGGVLGGLSAIVVLLLSGRECGAFHLT